MDTSLLGHPVIPPRHGQVDKHNIQAPVRNKGIKCTYSKVLRIIVTHTMIPRIIASWSKNHLSCRTKPKVMDVVDAAEKVEALKGRKYGPFRAMLKSILLSVLHV
jgi:hypothetical protein